MKKALIFIITMIVILSVVTTVSAISLSEKEDIYRVDEFTGNSLDKEFVIQWLMEDDNFIYHLHETSNSEKYVNRFLEGALTGINITGELISGNVSAAFEVKDDYYNAIKDILLSYSTNEKILYVEDAKSKIRLEYYTGFTDNLIKYGLTVPKFASLATELKGVKVTNQLETIDELYKEFENAVTGEGQQQLWSLLDEYVASAKFSEYLSDASEVVAYASKGLEIAQFSYDLFIELEAYNTINSQLTDVLQYLYQNSSSADVKKVAGELWVKSMSSKKENLQDAVNQVYAKIGEVGGETAIEVGIGIVASKLKVSSVLASAGLGITFGNLYSDLAFSTSDIREQLTFIEETNEISTVLATALQSKLNAYELRYPSSLGSYEERAKDAKDIILYSKLLLQTRRMGEKAYYTLKETAWDSAIVNNADSIIALLGINQFEKIEDWYASCCADFETAERILYSEIEVSMYQNLYEYPEENEDFEIVDGRLIAYYGSDSHPCVPYEVHTIGSEAFNAEALMTQLTIRGTTMETHSVANCGDLYSLYIPKSVTSIADEAIYNCPNVTIYGYDGTTAETYANNNNIPFHSLGSAIPDNDVYVSGDYTLSSGTLDLNGQTMYVGGDFIHTGGTLNLGSGKLIILGDYYITDYEGTGYSRGELNMSDENGHIIVYGDFIMDSEHSHEESLIAGTLEVKGDFTQKSSDFATSSIFNFSATNAHTVILSGGEEQIVSFEDPSYSTFYNLKIANTSGKVYFVNEWTIKGEILGDVNLSVDLTLYSDHLTISDQTITTPNLYLRHTSGLHLGENSKIDGNLYLLSGYILVDEDVEITGDCMLSYTNGYERGVYFNDTGAYLTVHGDFILDSDSFVSLGEGIFELKGNFIQKGTGEFWAEDYLDNCFIISGTGEQIISFENPYASQIGNLEVKNQSGLVHFKQLPVYGDIIGNVISRYDIMLYNKGVELKGRIEAPNIYAVGDGYLGLSKDSSIIGNLHQLAGILSVNDDARIVGDLIVSKTGEVGFSGMLQMNSGTAHLIVEGNFFTNTDTSSLTAGILEIKGDFTQLNSNDSNYNNGKYNFEATGSHKVILSGNGEQIVSFEAPFCSRFNILQVKNQTGLVKFESLSANEIEGDIVSNYDITMAGFGITLKNQTIEAPNIIIPYSMYGSEYEFAEGTIFIGNLKHYDKEILITGKTEIFGCYYMYDLSDVHIHDENSHLLIHNDLLHLYGDISLERGTLEVKGNYYTFNSECKIGGGRLIMNGVDGYFLVHKNFIINSSYPSFFLTAGILEIKGDFYQKSPLDEYGGETIDNFCPSENHTTKLSGIGKQVVCFEDPEYSQFNILVNENPYGVIFESDYRYNKLQIIYSFDFEVVEYNVETNQINVDISLNESLQSLNGNVIISLYDESNKLIECRIKELSELEPQTFNGLNDYEGTYIVKAFYWADMTSIRPLCPSVTKELATQ